MEEKSVGRSFLILSLAGILVKILSAAYVPLLNAIIGQDGIGIYNALLGNDRSVDKVCELLNKPRSKKEAKIYYKIV